MVRNGQKLVKPHSAASKNENSFKIRQTTFCCFKKFFENPSSIRKFMSKICLLPVCTEAQKVPSDYSICRQNSKIHPEKSVKSPMTLLKLRKFRQIFVITQFAAKIRKFILKYPLNRRWLLHNTVGGICDFRPEY
jgi:hypothetical protein